MTTKTTIRTTSKTTVKRSAPRPKRDGDGLEINPLNLGTDRFLKPELSDRARRRLFRQHLDVAEETARAHVAWVLSELKRSRRCRGKTIDEVVASIEDDASTDFLEVEARRAQLALAIVDRSRRVRLALRAKDAESAALAAGALFSACKEFDHAIDAPHALAELRSRDAHADAMRGRISAQAAKNRDDEVANVVKACPTEVRAVLDASDEDKGIHRELIARTLRRKDPNGLAKDSIIRKLKRWERDGHLARIARSELRTSVLGLRIG